MIQPDCYFFGAETVASLVSGPPSAEYQVYSAGDAPFDLGAEVWDAGRGYRSLVDNNSAALIDAASWKDTGEIDQGASLHDIGTTYALGDYAVRNTRVIRSAKDNNTTDPATGVDWADAGPTNRFRAFDLNSSASAVSTGEISWVFDASFSMNAMFLILPKGGFAYVTVEDGAQVEQDARTYRVTRDSGGGAYNHDFAPRESVSRIIAHGLPPGAGNRIKVRITGSEDQQVSVGQIAVGFAHDIGVTVTGSEVGATSFQDPTEDEFGNITFPNRPNRRTARFSFKGNIERNDGVLSRVTKNLNRPVGLYMVDGVSRGLCVYGYVREINLPMGNTVLTDGDMTIRGFAENDG